MSGSWRLVWRHKFLWFFGLFAGGSTSLGGWNCNYSSDSGSTPGTSFPRSDFDLEIRNWISSHLTLIVVVIASAFLAGLLLWLWSVICRGAVIGSVRDARSGATISFSSAFARGRESFWRLLLFDLFIILLFICLGIILVAIILLIIFLAGIAGVAGKVLLVLMGLWLLTLFGFGLGYLAICTIWFVPWVFIAILFNFALRAVVLEHERPMAAFRRGWQVTMRNLTQTLFLFLVSVGLSIGASIALVVAVGASAIPSVIAWVVAGSQGWPLTLVLLACGLTIIPVMVLLLAAALMNTYFTTYWTIGFDKLAGNEPADERLPQLSPPKASAAQG